MCFTSQSISPIVFTLHIIGHRFRSPFFARDSRSPPSLVATHTCAHTHSETPIPSDLLPRIRRVSAVSSDDDDDRRSFVLSTFTVLLHYASSADTGSLYGRKSIALPRLLLLNFSSCAAASTFYLLLHTLTLSLHFLSFAHSRVIPVPFTRIIRPKTSCFFTSLSRRLCLFASTLALHRTGRHHSPSLPATTQVAKVQSGWHQQLHDVRIDPRVGCSMDLWPADTHR